MLHTATCLHCIPLDYATVEKIGFGQLAPDVSKPAPLGMNSPFDPRCHQFLFGPHLQAREQHLQNTRLLRCSFSGVALKEATHVNLGQPKIRNKIVEADSHIGGSPHTSLPSMVFGLSRFRFMSYSFLFGPLSRGHVRSGQGL